MKNLKYVLFILLSSIFTITLHSQNSIDITSKGDKLLLVLKQDGKLYKKSYANWKLLREDPKLKTFSMNFIEACGFEFEKGFHFDLDNGIHIKSEGININIDSNKKKGSDNLVISISGGKKKNQ